MVVLAVLYAVIAGVVISGSFNTINTMDPASFSGSPMDLVGSILEALMLPIAYGVLVYEVKLVRKQPYELKEIFSHYSKFWPIFCLSFLVGLFSALWSLLLIIPGIIAALSYSMSMMLMIDGDEDPMSCIRRSKAMMNGYKWDYFVFQFSFILWYLLGAITFGLAYIYVVPYVQVAEILYYEKLKEINPAK